MGEAAQAQPAPAAEAPKPDNDTRPAVKAEPKADIRDKLVEDLKKQSRKRERDEAKAKESPKPAAAPAAPKAKEPPKEEPASEARPATKDPKASTPKDAPKAKDGKPADASEGSEDQPGDTDELKAFRAQKRDFAKYQRKTERRYEEREAQVSEREQRVEARERTLIADIKRDPMAALRALGVDVRKEIMSWVDADAEDPKDKRLRELDERTKRAEEKLSEREKQEKAQRQSAAVERVTGVLQQAFTDAEPDDYPLLYEGYEPAEIARIATNVVLKHYEKTGQQLAPERVFAYLEEVEREDHQRRSARRQTIGAKTAPESREQVPPVESASPERRPRASDVTNRATRIGASNGSTGPLKGEALREHLVAMAREAMHR